jgi:serine/threonine protein phosphatase PrpC
MNFQLQGISQAAPIPNRINEDTCYQMFDGTQLILAVIDGASQRLAAGSMEHLFDIGIPNASVAAQAARLVQQTIHRNSPSSPDKLLIASNNAIRDAIECIYGSLSVDRIFALDGEKALLKEDGRYLRLVLPVCVATVIHLNLERYELEFAHLGDTALLVFYKDGRVEQITKDSMGQHDEQALLYAIEIQKQRRISYLSDAIDHPETRQINFLNGIYHNFVTPNGDIDYDIGVGVIDGLPEMTKYLQRGILSLHDVRSILICSDGFFLPQPLLETKDARLARLQEMRRLLEITGIFGYIQKLRKIEQDDVTRNAYPRFKVHDDATAFYLEFKA